MNFFSGKFVKKLGRAPQKFHGAYMGPHGAPSDWNFDFSGCLFQFFLFRNFFKVAILFFLAK